MKQKVLLFVLFMCIASLNLLIADENGGGLTLSQLDERLKKVESQQSYIEKSLAEFNKKTDDLANAIKKLSDTIEKLSVPQNQTLVQVPAQIQYITPVKIEPIFEIKIDDSETTLTASKVPNIVNFIKNVNPNIPKNVNVQNIIETYFIEAKKEGINPEIAIAQMCYVTRYFKNTGIVSDHNYGGLAPTAKGKIVNPDITHGVRAHIQHLKGYSSNIKEEELKEKLADQRWDAIEGLRGSAKTLRQLAVKWSPSNMEYETNVSNIIFILRKI